ncbi:N-acetylmuramoyl-L-alanine amidase [Paenibacillus sp. GCM10027627]|uniref:N-acetylmuramoyl-L-alanine amidase n=1 Tax=unclassified Paenibacillus TaxID=185978 RepID=UPI003629158C
MNYQIVEQLLTPNKFSRPQLTIRKIKGIVIHWVANPNTSAKNNRDFFESRKGGLKSFGSAHEIIDLDGDVVLCIPKNELAYHAGSALPYKSGSTQIYTPLAWERLNTNLPRNIKPYPNNCTYSIEATHVDWDGTMTPKTYQTLIERCIDLCKEFELNPLTDLYLHQEVVGWKDCHRWFVNNPIEWKIFKERVHEKILEDEPMTKDEKQAFEDLKKTVESQNKTIEILSNSLKTLQDKDKLSKIPDFAKEAIEAAVKAKLINTPNGGSYEFYRIVTILYRQGLFGRGKI